MRFVEPQKGIFITTLGIQIMYIFYICVLFSIDLPKKLNIIPSSAVNKLETTGKL